MPFARLRLLRLPALPQPDVQLAQLLLGRPAFGASREQILRRAASSGTRSRRGSTPRPPSASTMRSRPNAMPPCGGAPYCSASSRKPNFACAVLGADAERARTPSPARRAGGSAPSRRRSPSRSARCRTPWRRAAPGSVSSRSSWPSFGRGERMMHRAPSASPPRPTRTSGSRPPTAAASRLRRSRARGRSSARSAPSASLTTFALSAPKKMRSPSARRVRSRIVAQHVGATGT